MSGFESPNYTQVPNSFFDMMADMTDAEIRITLIAIRQIIGFHKTKPEAISVTQFMGKTGLSRQGVLDGIEAAVTRGTVKKEGTGKRNVTKFSLVVASPPEVVNEPDWSTELTSQDTTSQASRPVTSQASRPTKENNKEKESPKEKIVAMPQAVMEEKSEVPETTTTGKTLEKKPAEYLADAMGIKLVTGSNDWSVYTKRAKQLIAAGIPTAEFGQYVSRIRREAAGKWKVTVNSLVNNGRMAEYVTARDKYLESNTVALAQPQEDTDAFDNYLLKQLRGA